MARSSQSQSLVFSWKPFKTLNWNDHLATLNTHSSDNNNKPKHRAKGNLFKRWTDEWLNKRQHSRVRQRERIVRVRKTWRRKSTQASVHGRTCHDRSFSSKGEHCLWSGTFIMKSRHLAYFLKFYSILDLCLTYLTVGRNVHSWCITIFVLFGQCRNSMLIRSCSNAHHDA